MNCQNRELQIMRMIKHPNAVELLNSFYEKSKGEVYLNLVLGYVSRNLFEVSSSYTKRNERVPMEHIQVRFLSPLLSHSLISSCTCTNCAEHWPMSTLSVFVIVTSSHKIF